MEKRKLTERLQDQPFVATTVDLWSANKHTTRYVVNFTKCLIFCGVRWIFNLFVIAWYFCCWNVTASHSKSAVTLNRVLFIQVSFRRGCSLDRPGFSHQKESYPGVPKNRRTSALSCACQRNRWHSLGFPDWKQSIKNYGWQRFKLNKSIQVRVRL